MIKTKLTIASMAVLTGVGLGIKKNLNQPEHHKLEKSHQNIRSTDIRTAEDTIRLSDALAIASVPIGIGIPAIVNLIVEYFFCQGADVDTYPQDVNTKEIQQWLKERAAGFLNTLDKNEVVDELAISDVPEDLLNFYRDALDESTQTTLTKQNFLKLYNTFVDEIVEEIDRNADGFVSAEEEKATYHYGIGEIFEKIKASQTLQEEIKFSKHGVDEVVYPLNTEGKKLLEETLGVSPTLPGEIGIRIDPNEFIHSLKLDKVGAAEFWAEFRDVLDARDARLNNSRDFGFEIPDIFSGFSQDEAAESVRNDFPALHPLTLATKLDKEGARIDPNIIPLRSQDDFVRGRVLLSRLIGWAVSEVSPTAFATKWAVGYPRPEEIAWKIAQGEIVAPADIEQRVQNMGLSSAEDFTAYSEGSPVHPSWPAMHSAASSASLYLAVVMDLTPEQMQDIIETDYAVAFFRTVAGVHYPADNLAGLTIGQSVIEQELPDFLAREYGSNPEKVREKINQVKVDWYAYHKKIRGESL